MGESMLQMRQRPRGYTSAMDDETKVVQLPQRRDAERINDEPMVADEKAARRAAEEARVRDKFDKLTRLQASRQVKFDAPRREMYLELLAIGYSQSKAAGLVQVHPNSISYHRRHDAQFAGLEAEAIALGADDVLDRLREIAETGDPGSMATIRAAETVLKGTKPEYQPPKAGAGVKMTRQADGSQSLEVRAASWWKDD